MRLGVGLLGSLVVALVVGGAAPAAGVRDAASDPLVTVRYSGTLDATNELHATHPRGPDTHQSHIQWSLVWQGSLSKLRTKASQLFTTRVLKGNVEYADRINPSSVSGSDRNDCTGTYSAKPETRVPVVVTVDPDNRKGFGVQLTRPTSATYLVSSNKRSNWDFCTRIFAGTLPSKSQVVSPFFSFPAKGGTRPNSVRHVQNTSPDDKSRTLVEETVAVTVGDASPPADGAATNAKKVARDDLRRALQRAKGPCLQLAISLGVLATGAVWTSVAAPIPGGIPAGASVIATGAVMGSAIAPICNELIKQIVVAYSIYKKDPPVPKLATAFRLPSCARWEGKVRAYCADLSAAVTELVTAESKVLPTLKRLQDAAAGLARAHASGSARAGAKARAEVDAAAASLRAARRAASAAGANVAGVIEQGGVQGTLSRPDSARVVGALLGELGKRGVPASDLRRIAPAAIRTGQIDVLVALRT